MMTSRALILLGTCALLAHSVSASQDVGKEILLSDEVEAVFSALAAFLREYRENLAPLAVPTEARLSIAKKLLKRTIPAVVRRLPHDEGVTLLDGVEKAMGYENEHLRIYGLMKELRDRIIHEGDPFEEAAMREQMAKYIGRMEENFDEAILIGNSVSGISPAHLRLFMGSPLMEAVREVYDTGVLQPFRQYT